MKKMTILLLALLFSAQSYAVGSRDACVEVISKTEQYQMFYDVEILGDFEEVVELYDFSNGHTLNISIDDSKNLLRVRSKNRLKLRLKIFDIDQNLLEETVGRASRNHYQSIESEDYSIFVLIGKCKNK